jgi:hypothetical protein
VVIERRLGLRKSNLIAKGIVALATRQSRNVSLAQVPSSGSAPDRYELRPRTSSTSTKLLNSR